MTQLEAAPSQDVQWTLADMSVRVDAARLLAHRAASLKDAGERPMREAAAAKLFAAETAMWVASRAVELCGADGCRGGSLVERCYRDAKITEIYEGTSEIQRLILGEQIWRNATSESQWQPAAVH
jgi:alkylation response protein AidB-like acyl-CoA dehydrogenase